MGSLAQVLQALDASMFSILRQWTNRTNNLDLFNESYTLSLINLQILLIQKYLFIVIDKSKLSIILRACFNLLTVYFSFDSFFSFFLLFEFCISQIFFYFSFLNSAIYSCSRESCITTRAAQLNGFVSPSCLVKAQNYIAASISK